LFLENNNLEVLITRSSISDQEEKWKPKYIKCTILWLEIE